MALLELDYMEYANDGAAQAAYPTSSNNQDGLIENFETYTDSEALRYNTSLQEIAQSFKIGSNYNVQYIQIFLFKDGTIAAGKKVWIYIYNDSGGVPGTAISVQSNLIEANSITAGGGWYDFTFSSVSLTANTTYWIVLQGDYAIDIDNHIRWREDYPSGGYANGQAAVYDGTTWSVNAYDNVFKIYANALECWSEATIKNQGSYSLKGIGLLTSSLNKTLTRTIGSPIDLSDRNTIKFDIRASRTGANIKIGIHDSGGVTTEKTYTVLAGDTWETVTWDISGVSNANKDAIDNIIITITNADADNTFYIDNFYELPPPLSINVSESLSIAESIGGKGGTLPASVSDAITLIESVLLSLPYTIDISDIIIITENILASLPDALKTDMSDSISITEVITASLPDALKLNPSDVLAIAENIKFKLTSFINVSESISLAETIIASLPDALKLSVTDAVSLAESINAAISACVLSATEDISITEAVELIIPFYSTSVSDAIAIAESVSVWFPYYDVYSLDLYVDQVRSFDLFIATTKTFDMYIDQVRSFTMEH